MSNSDYKNRPRKWSDLSHAGESLVPAPSDSSAYSWPLFFLKRDTRGNFTDYNGNQLALFIRHPDTIDFVGEQLKAVKQTLNDLTFERVCIAEYWNAGSPTKQWTPDEQYDEFGAKIDIPITENHQAKLMPPPYRQVIEYKKGRKSKSLFDPRQCPEAR